MDAALRWGACRHDALTIVWVETEELLGSKLLTAELLVFNTKIQLLAEAIHNLLTKYLQLGGVCLGFLAQAGL